MRLSLGFVFLAATLFGCTSRNLGYENGGDMGRVDLAPLVECTDSECEGCWRFDEQSCASHPGCAPIYCESSCAEAPVFQGCLGKNQGAPLCPPDDCLPRCEKSSECPSGQFCHAADQSYCACEWTDSPCNGDGDCGADEVCHWSECTCEPGNGACIPACKSDGDCAPGEACEQKHCREKKCGQDVDCPAQFSCVKSFDDRARCQRTTCASDSACDGGYCVDGQCYANAGMCTWLPD